MNLENYKAENATHELSCRHCIGRSRFTKYTMKCIVIKSMPGNRSKIVVFGDRFWMNKDHVKHIRYVNNERLAKQ